MNDLIAGLGRRQVLAGGAALGALAFLGVALPASAAPAEAQAPAAEGLRGLPFKRRNRLPFEALASGRADTIRVPAGYKATPFIPWGTPISGSYPGFLDDASNSAQDQAEQIGMHHDGMHFFPIDAQFGFGGGHISNHGLLVLNHEYIDAPLLHTNGPTVVDGKRTVADEVRRKSTPMAFPSWRSVATCVASGMSCRRNAIGGSPPPRRCVSPARRAATNCCAPATVRTAPAPAAPTTTVPTVSPLGHLPHLRGELGRLFLHPGQRTAARTDPLRHSQHQPFRLGDPGGRRVRALRRHPQGQTGSGRLPQRTEQLRLDRRDRPVRPAIGTGQAHRSRPLRPRRPGLRPGRAAR